MAYLDYCNNQLIGVASKYLNFKARTIFVKICLCQVIVICSRKLVIIALVPVVGGNGGGQQEIDERDDEGSGRITRDQVSDGGRH